MNILALLVFIALQTLKVSINAYDFFLSIVIVTSLAQWHFIIFVIDEMTSVLQIRVFRVKPKQAAQETAAFRVSDAAINKDDIEMHDNEDRQSVAPFGDN